MSKPDLSYAIGLPPEKAVEYFKSKGYTFSWNWKDTWQEAHAKAFTVAKVMRLDILQDIKDMVHKSLDEGITLQQFTKELMPKLQAKGWWGRRLLGDETGAATVQLGSPYRLRTIYQTNLQTSYMAGRYKDFMDNIADRPYWQYVAVMDSRTRPSHAALNGKVFRYDDPFWKAFFPPNGWNCRCRVRALSERNLKSKGITPETSEDKLSTQDKLVSKRTGETAKVTAYRDPVTGMEIAPDAGWSYNPGQAAFDPFVPRPAGPAEFGTYKTVGITGYKPPIETIYTKPLSKDMLLPSHQKSGWGEEDYINAFLGEFGTEIGGTPVLYRDVLNDPLAISESLFEDRAASGYKVMKADREIYLKLLADTIKDPSEVWLTWVKGKDEARLCKRYIGLYKSDKGKTGGYVVFDLVDDMWQGTTAFETRTTDYLDRQRTGTLLYTKK